MIQSREFSGGKRQDTKRNKYNNKTKKSNNKTKQKQNNQHKNTFAARPTNKQEKKLSKKKSRPPLDPNGIRHKQPSTTFIPPALLLPTASPFAYVARAALMVPDDESDSDTLPTDPLEMARTIFADVVVASSPSSDPNDDDKDNAEHLSSYYEPLAGMTFEYFPPKVFDHELPTADGTKSAMIPEVAFLGRSNVGKSSLVNALMRKDLARCSKHPGRTQQPYYFGLLPNKGTTDVPADPRDCQGFLVDLPGYGFAKAPTEAAAKWQEQTQEFLKNRRDLGSLQRLFLLMDARRGMLGSRDGNSGGQSSSSSSPSLDLAVMNWMDEEAIPYTIVITKADCVSKPQLVKVANEACMRYQQQHQEEQEHILYGNDEDNADDGSDDEQYVAGWMSPVVHITSATKDEGLQELRSAVEAEFLSQ